jgi:hypothetical protein
MGQEYFINSQELESKVRDLLPSQGGAGAGFDLSASTQIIPIIDLTESAEGSNLRADLQSAFSHKSITAFAISGSTADIVTTTGYYRVFGIFSSNSNTTGKSASISVDDGATSKELISFTNSNGMTDKQMTYNSFDFIVLLEAGDKITGTTNSSDMHLRGITRQIAALDKTLTNP